MPDDLNVNQMNFYEWVTSNNATCSQQLWYNISSLTPRVLNARCQLTAINAPLTYNGVLEFRAGDLQDLGLELELRPRRCAGFFSSTDIYGSMVVVPLPDSQRHQLHRGPRTVDERDTATQMVEGSGCVSSVFFVGMSML